MKIITSQLRWLLPLLVALPLLFLMQSWWGRGLFLIGTALGIGLVWLDETQLWKWYEDDASTQPQLITRSPLFLIVLVPLSIFVVTSTGSAIGMGLILAIALILCVEMWSRRTDVTAFHARFGKHLLKDFSAQEVERISWAAVGFVGLLLFLVLT